MDKTNFSARRRVWSAVMRCLMVLCAALTCALAAFLVIDVLVKGVPNLSWALLRTCFGPAWPECLLEERMPSGALERAEGDNAPGGAGVENHHREDD